MAHDTITITGHYTGPTGADSAGLVHIAPDVPVILDAAAAVILEGSEVVPLVAGAFSVEVPDPRDVTLNPTGFGYVVTPVTEHRHHSPVRFLIPPEVVDTIDMADVTPVTGPLTVPPTSYASLGALLALDSELNDVETALAETNTTADALAATMVDSDNALQAMIETKAAAADHAALAGDVGLQGAYIATVDEARIAHRAMPDYADNVGPYDPLRNAYNWKASNTRKTRAGLGRARAGLGVWRAVCIGDSATEGKTGAATFDRVKSWPAEMRARLAAGGIPAAGDGLVKGGGPAAPYDTRVTFTGAWTQNSGYLSSVVNGATATFTFSTPNTHFDVWSSGTSGQFTIKVDGGAVLATVNPTGAAAWVKTTVNVAAGMHTLTVTKTNVTATAILAVDAYSTSGALVHNWGHAGWSAADWNTFTQWFQGAGSIEQLVPDALADTVFIGLGANDIALQAKTPAQAVASLEQYAARWLGPDLVLCIIQHGQGIAEATWDEYCGRMYDLADTLDVPLVDITARIGTFTEGNANGLYGDNAHLTAAGSADWGRNMGSLLLA